MQMYEGLPVITNKIPKAERGGIPHHMLDLVGYDEQPWHVGVFTQESLKIINAIHERGKVPILVGGTHYYTKALLFKESLVDDAAEPGTRPASEADGGHWSILSAPTEEILEKLKSVDPIMARRWHPNDRRKIQRSLEIWLQTGRPASEIYAEQSANQRSLSPGYSVEGREDILKIGVLRYPTMILWLKAEKDALNARLEARVEKMIDDGLIQESEALYDFNQKRREASIHDDLSRGIWVSIGYKEFLDYIVLSRRGDASFEELNKLKSDSIERIKISTRQYAKRQDRFIRLRLIGNIVRSGILSNLFVLDSSTTATLETDTIPQAASIAEAFLGGKNLPTPKELSPLAEKTFSSIEMIPVEKINATISQCYTCEACRKILETPAAWEAHLASRKHRQTIASREKKAITKQQPNS